MSLTISKNVNLMYVLCLRGLEVTFPPHDPSDADEKIQRTSPPGGTLSCLTRVVYLLHVKGPQAPRGPMSKIIGQFPSKQSFQFLRQMGEHGTIYLRRKGAS
jgi:hypothetical protein